MRTIETSTSPSPPCHLLNLVLSAVLFLQSLLYAQVNKNTYRATTSPLITFSSLTLIRHHFFSTGSGECLEHGYVLNSRYQVVYPFPTFQPAFQLKKDQVILLNTSYSLVACGISLCPGKTHTNSKIATFLISL